MFEQFSSRNVHHERNKMTLWCCCHDNNFAAVPVLIGIKILSFCVNQVPSTLSNLMRRAETIWEACLFWARHSVALERIENGDIWFLIEREWSQERCHCNSATGVILFRLHVIYFSGAKFEDYHSNVSRDILDSAFYNFICTVYYVITFVNCLIQNVNISKLKEWHSKTEKAILSSSYFSFHRYFMDEKNSSYAHKTGSCYFIRVLFKISV